MTNTQRQTAVMVCVAAVLLFCAVGVLGWQLSWQAALLQRQTHQRKMQENMSVLTKSTMDSGLRLIKFNTLGDQKFLDEAEQHSIDACRALEALQQEATAAEKPKVEAVKADYLKLEELNQTARQAAKTDSRLDSLRSAMYMKKQGGRLVTKLQTDAAMMEDELMLQAGTESTSRMLSTSQKIGVMAYGASFLAFIILLITGFKTFRAGPRGGV